MDSIHVEPVPVIGEIDGEAFFGVRCTSYVHFFAGKKANGGILQFRRKLLNIVVAIHAKMSKRNVTAHTGLIKLK